MKAFRFRAASALELRKRHEDTARLVLTRAQNVASVADQRLAVARTSLDDARAQLLAVQSAGAPAWLIGWHRSWIVQRSRDVDTCEQHAATAQSMVAKASAVLREAHKKRRVLERLRDRLAARHARVVEQQELAHMNELATMRYLIARAEYKEQP